MKPIRYRVLLADQMSKADKIAVAAKVSTLYTGPEAKACSYRQIAPGQFENENWQYEIKDYRGQVGVLMYKGVEAAVFYKRQVTEVEPLPVDPVPEGVIRDPDDAWVRLDLLGLSARRAGGRLGKQKRAGDEALTLAEKELAVKEQLLGTIETENFNLRKDLEKKAAEIAKLRAELKSWKGVGGIPTSAIGIPPNTKARRAVRGSR